MCVPARTILCAALAVIACAGPAVAQRLPADYQDALAYLGRQGDYKADVFKVNIPRGDLAVTVAGVNTPTPFGFGGWVAMTKGDGGMDVMMGDLVLTQDEVNPVMSALLERGLDVTALHNHFFWDEPRIFYMHVHGRGTPFDLAHRLKPALDLIGRGSARPAPDIALVEHGAPITARMGLNTWAAFYGSAANAVIAGDIAMLSGEVTPVLKALRAHGLDVVAIHHHMTGTDPVVIFLHYWGKGRAEDLAAGFKAALDETGKGPRMH